MIDLPLMKCIRRFETTAAFAAVKKMHDHPSINPAVLRPEMLFTAMSHGAKEPEPTSMYL